MRLRNEGQKRDPKIGKKYIILIYQGIQRAIQIPLSPPVKSQIESEPFKMYVLKGFLFLLPS